MSAAADTLAAQARLAALTARMHAVVAGIEGMKALNTERERGGYALAYGKDAFHAEAEVLREIANDMDAIAREGGAAMTQHTQGPWRPSPKNRPGVRYGAVVADHPVPGVAGSEDTAFYGGHLIAESVAEQNVPIIAAAPELLDALGELIEHFDVLVDEEYPESQQAELKSRIELQRALFNRIRNGSPA